MKIKIFFFLTFTAAIAIKDEQVSNEKENIFSDYIRHPLLSERDISTCKKNGRSSRQELTESHRIKKKDLVSLVYLLDPDICAVATPQSLEAICPGTKVYAFGVDGTSPVYNDADAAFNDIKRIAATRNFNRVIFLAHGWVEDFTYLWMYDLKDEIIQHHPDQIVVLIEWEHGASPLLTEEIVTLYQQSLANILIVGQYIANIATHLKQDSQTKNLSLYGIGHSMGAHMIGKAARYSDGAFDRVTGLDPAGPCFDSYNTGLSLAPDDAPLVDVIHTDGNPGPFTAIPFHMGSLAPMGDLDFYPNWGRRPQPGCLFVRDLKATVINSFGCSHMRAVFLYQWSVSKPGKFLTKKEILMAITKDNIKSEVPLDNTYPPAEMGYFADKGNNTKVGNFFIETNGRDPFIR